MFDVVINTADSQESPLFRMVGDDLPDLIDTAMERFDALNGTCYQCFCWLNGRLFRFATVEGENPATAWPIPVKKVVTQ